MSDLYQKAGREPSNRSVSRILPLVTTRPATTADSSEREFVKVDVAPENDSDTWFPHLPVPPKSRRWFLASSAVPAQCRRRHCDFHPLPDKLHGRIISSSVTRKFLIDVLTESQTSAPPATPAIRRRSCRSIPSLAAFHSVATGTRHLP